MDAVHALALALLVQPLAQVLTVDDDGPADFSDIQPAIDAAAPGDVILVHPGEYEKFTLNKRVHIMGASDAALQEVDGGHVQSGAEHFELSGLLFSDELRITAVNGRGRLDDVGTETWDGALLITDCASIELSRMNVYGRIEVTNSAVSITSSTLEGLDGADGFSCGFSGLHGLHLREQSFAWIADTTIQGGSGGAGLVSPCCDGNGGHGLLLQDGSAALVRGRPGNLIDGGFADIGYCGIPGLAIAAQGGSRLAVSGVTVGGGGVVIDPSSELLAPPAPEPWIRITAPDAAGVRSVQMFGEAGVPIALAASFAKPTLELPSLLEAPLWVSPSALVFLATFQLTGFGAPVEIDVAVNDPALYGVTLGIQAVCPTLASVLEPGTLVVSNPTALVFQPSP